MLSYLIDQITRLFVAHAQTNTLTQKLDQQLQGSSYFQKLVPVGITGQAPSIANIIDLIVSVILYAAGFTAVVYLLYAGIIYITAGGEDAKAEKGRKGIVNAVIGIIVILLSFAIEKVIAAIFS